MAINFPENPEISETYILEGTTWEYNGFAWNIVTSAGPASEPDTFKTISVQGQQDIVADKKDDNLTLVAGENITITTNPDTDSITITSTAEGGGGDGEVIQQNLFSAIAGDTGSQTASSPTDTITFAGGTDISTSVDAGVLTISYTGEGGGGNGAAAFTELSDVQTAGVTLDELFLPAITKLEVTNNGASSYRFDQYGSTDNPGLYVITGTTIAFKLNVTGHPFLIQDGTGSNYSTGLVHVSTGGTVSTGINAQGKTSGTLYWKVPIGLSSPPNFRYQCSVHASMVGAITIKSISAI